MATFESLIKAYDFAAAEKAFLQKLIGLPLVQKILRRRHTGFNVHSRVTSHIPDKGQVMIRYYGLYLNMSLACIRIYRKNKMVRDYIKIGILGICFLSLLLSGTTLFSVDLPAVDQDRGEWTLVVIPDTQGYAENWGGQGFFYSEMQDTFEWIPTISDQMNIKVVQSVGDMVECMRIHNTTEWERVNYCYSYLMDRGIPAIPAAGNHEWENDEDFTWMNNYFDLSEYQQYSWWGGHYEGMQNTYQLFTIGEEDYLFLTIQYQAGSSAEPAVNKQDVVDWAGDVIASYPDRKVIFTSHWNEDASHFSQIIDPNPNVIMTLAGHHDRDDYYVTKERTHNFIQNYQFKGKKQDETGDMQIRFYVFKPMDDEVEWFTYSYVEDYFWTKDSDSQGTFTLIQEDPIDGPKEKIFPDYGEARLSLLSFHMLHTAEKKLPFEC
jgi:hypothetical protein